MIKTISNIWLVLRRYTRGNYKGLPGFVCVLKLSVWGVCCLQLPTLTGHLKCRGPWERTCLQAVLRMAFGDLFSPLLPDIRSYLLKVCPLSHALTDFGQWEWECKVGLYFLWRGSMVRSQYSSFAQDCGAAGNQVREDQVLLVVIFFSFSERKTSKQHKYAESWSYLLWNNVKSRYLAQ